METRLAAPSVVVLIGPSGSGKSTWAATNFQQTEVVSSDELRSRVGVDESDQRASPVAFELLERIVAERVARGLTTVIDTLGFDIERRGHWIQLAHDNGIPIYAMTFPTPLEECLRRNSTRKRPLPIAVIKKQAGRFQEVVATLEDEGFDGIQSETPVRLVVPQMTTGPSQPPPSPPQGHSFGLLLSRFNWGKEKDIADDLKAISVRAEAAGFRDIWLMDHFRQIPQVGQPWEDMPEVYTTLAHIAAHTSTIRLGALVSSVTHRHPAVLGRIIATLDVISNGRANCGIGLGWDQKEHTGYGIEFPDVAERYAILEDTLQMLPLLWGKGSPAFAGKVFTASDLTCYPRPLQERVPILIGGSGEKRTLRLVAKYGDAANLFGRPPVVAHKVEVLRQHCVDVERDPDEVEVGHLVTAMVAPDADGLRGHIEQLRARSQSAEQFAISKNAGLADDVVELFRSYRSAGVAHSVVALPNVHLEGGIEAFGAVIAALGD